MLVDSPGYGFAEGSKQEVDSWKKLMMHYLKASHYLHRVAIVIDGRIGPEELDLNVGAT